MNPRDFDNFRSIQEIWDEIEREHNFHIKKHTLRRIKSKDR